VSIVIQNLLQKYIKQKHKIFPKKKQKIQQTKTIQNKKKKGGNGKHQSHFWKINKIEGTQTNQQQKPLQTSNQGAQRE